MLNISTWDAGGRMLWTTTSPPCLAVALRRQIPRSVPLPQMQAVWRVSYTLLSSHHSGSLNTVFTPPSAAGEQAGHREARWKAYLMVGRHGIQTKTNPPLPPCKIKQNTL